MAKLWETLMEHDGGVWPKRTTNKHLLWALHLKDKKVHQTEAVMEKTTVGCADEKLSACGHGCSLKRLPAWSVI
jgi:hypothetical protein